MIKTLLLGVAAMIGSNTNSSIVLENEVLLQKDQVVTIEAPGGEPFDGITLFSPEGETVPNVEYLGNDGTWHAWHYEHYAPHIVPGSVLELQLFIEAQTSLQVRSSETKKLIAHFYNTHTEDAWMTASSGDFNPFVTDGAEEELDRFAKKNKVARSKFYSRSAWGADESLRVSSITQRLFNRKNSGLPSEIDDFPVKYKPKIIEDSYDGKPLRWPVAEMPRVYKFVVHHTGEYVDPKKHVRRDPFKTMRAIYMYHTITLGWGDIGYHYVIDKQGNIYEGRSGGPKAIGAHVAYYNAGTIGISLMGNFNVEKPTDAQIHSLTILLADNADRFNIDPGGRSYYLNHMSYNISGHRDVTAAGRGTACPGENLYAMLPSIRKKTADYIKIIQEGRRYKQVTRNMLQKSRLAPQQKKRRSFIRPEKRQPVVVQDVTKPKLIQRMGSAYLSLEVMNNTDFRWPKGIKMTATNVPEGLTVDSFKNDQDIEPGQKGNFTAKVRVRSTPNGKYTITVEPTFLKSKLNETTYNRLSFSYPLQISGSRDFLTQKRVPINKRIVTTKRPGFSLKSLQTSLVSETKTLSFGDLDSTKKNDSRVMTKIKLSSFDQNYALVSSTKEIIVPITKKTSIAIPAGKTVKLVANRSDGRNYVEVTDHKKKTYRVRVALLQTEGILTIHNYDRGINKQIPFNSFRSDLKFYPQDDQKLMVVNELPLEEYLYGLGEETSSEPIEKRKAILILARSYALVYGKDNRRKFRTDLYDLEDSPKTSQLYLGYDWERYHSTQKNIVDKTKGLVLTHQGFPIIGPYFTQSSGHSSGAWVSQYPWAKVQPLPYDKGLEARGHGVGFSGNSARVLAEKGKNYEEIIDYFFTGVDVLKKY